MALSWQCETAEGNNKLRRQILKRAERKWLDILLDCCYINCASGLSESETARHHRISPSISELTQIFQDIFPILFRPQHHKVVFLRGWLWSYVREFHSEIKLHLMVQYRHPQNFVKQYYSKNLILLSLMNPRQTKCSMDSVHKTGAITWMWTLTALARP